MGVSYPWENGNNDREQEEGRKEQELGDGIVITPHIAATSASVFPVQTIMEKIKLLTGLGWRREGGTSYLK